MSPIKWVTTATESDLEKIEGKGRKANPLYEEIANLLKDDHPAKVEVDLKEKENENKIRTNIFVSLRRKGIDHPSISKIESEVGEGHITLIIRSGRKEGE
jgi:hypothetical protein